MKRLVICILSFVLGLTGGSSIRFSQYWRAGYRQGYVVAVDELQREAVREGHGHWERAGDSIKFRWNEFRTGYAPETRTCIPGVE